MLEWIWGYKPPRLLSSNPRFCPQGEELGDKELIQSEGEVGLLVWVVGIIWGVLTGWATYEMTKAWGAAGAAVAGAIAAGGGLAIGAAASGPSRLQY